MVIVSRKTRKKFRNLYSGLIAEKRTVTRPPHNGSQLPLTQEMPKLWTISVVYIGMEKA